MKPYSLTTQLGYPTDARLVIFHADDVGMCHGSNRAYFDLCAAGILKTGSLMLPCPWSQEMLNVCRTQPHLDLGVHLTLTSEWTGYRWGPISRRDPASGLIDEQGYFWRRTPMVQAAMQEETHLQAAVHEMRTQIERARTAGLDFTHLDTHMGAAALPELVAAYAELGFAYGVPALIPREINHYLRSLNMAERDETQWASLIAQLEVRGMPIIDRFIITPGYNTGDREGGRAEFYEQMLRTLPPGVTFFSLHPNAPGDIEVIVPQEMPDRASWRTFEYEYFQSQRLQDFLAQAGIVSISFREIREVMRNNRRS